MQGILLHNLNEGLHFSAFHYYVFYFLGGVVTGYTLGVMNLISSEATIAQCSRLLSARGGIVLYPADEGQKPKQLFRVCTFFLLRV